MARSGQQAPGAPAGVVYAALSGARLNNSGKTSFVSTLSGPGTTTNNDEVLLSDVSGAIALIAREGSNAPGTPAGVNFFLGFIKHSLSNSGQVGFFAILAGTGVTSANDRGFWSTAPGSLSLVARRGSPAPGTPAGVNFGMPFPSSIMSGAGRTAITGALSGSGVNAANDYGIWIERVAGLGLVAREGGQAPGTPNGVNFVSLGIPRINSAGQVAFTSMLTGAGVTTTNDAGLWRETAGSLELIARSGEPLLSLPPGVFISQFSPISEFGINGAGQVASRVTLAGPGVSASNDAGVWANRPSGAGLVARRGDQAPGAPSGVKFGFFADANINSSGKTLFLAELEGPGVTATNNVGVWIEGAAGLNLLAREGSQAPGTPDSTLFFGWDFTPTINAAGQAAFRATLTGAGVTAANDAGIWATDSAGVLRLVVREGDLLEVAPGDLRTVTALNFTVGGGNEDGRPMSINDRGQLIFAATFSDGSSGVFLDERLAVSAGDYNRDGAVNATDLGAWRTAYGHTGSIHAADGDLDRDVDGDDFLVWQRNLGAPTPIVAPTQSVAPEPATAILLAAALLVAPRGRRVLI